MTSKTKLLIALALVGAAVSATAAQPEAGTRPAQTPVAKSAAESQPQAPQHGIPEKFTREEALKRAAAQFDMLDANKDGVVTREEVMAFQEKLRAQHQFGGPQGGPPGGAGKPPAAAKPAK